MGDHAVGAKEESTARAICWVYTPNGELFEGDPRMVLARSLDYAANLGYKFNTGPELEFFLFKDTIGDIAGATHDSGGYFDLTGDLGADVRKDMVDALEGMGIKVETSHHEVAKDAPALGRNAATRDAPSASEARERPSPQ